MNYVNFWQKIVKNPFTIRLKRLRKSCNLTQEQLACALGVPTLWINKYETGKTQPSVEIIVKIAKYFGVTTDYLLGVSDQTHP